MEKKNNIALILSIVICLLPMILGAISYNELPEPMPIHFTLNDVPDNYAPKAFAVFGIPIIMAIVQAICVVIMLKSNKFENDKEPKLLKIFKWFIPVITVLIYILMLSAALEKNIHIGKSVCLILGVLFIIIGNYLPKTSYEDGKKVFHPTPKNEKTFRKMSKIMGYGFVGIGIILLILIIVV